jgi:hypothetical protein
MEPREALDQITEIRQQMARSEVFRGYRSLTVGAVGLLGALAAIVQPYLVPSPASDLLAYLMLWIGVAVVAFLLVALGLWRRVRTTGSPLVRQLTLLSADRLVPSVAIGALLTLAIYRGAPDVGWMLPGLWSFVFSLGVFASGRQLPRQAFWVGVYFAMCGVGCLLWGQGTHAFSPWQMGISFGGGMLISAAILYWTLERTNDSQE